MPGTWTVIPLRKGDLELRLLPGIGGRLWDVVFRGRSLLFQNPDLVERPFTLEAVGEMPTRSPQFRFPLWGGEKTWIAPDSRWVARAPFPMLDSGPYRVASRSPDLIEMVSRTCPSSFLSVRRRITLMSASEWSIDHQVANEGEAERPVGIWSVMMIDHPAAIGVSGAASTIRPVFGDAAALVRPVAAGIVCACAERREFKVGLPNPEGRTLIRCGGTDTWLLCVTDPPEPADTFAHGHPFEVFNSGDYAYCEAEWHSPAATLAPGETLSFRQGFRVWSGSHPPGDAALRSSEQELIACMF